MIKRRSRQDSVKAVAPVVGFMLITAIVFLAAAQYQSNVVPQQERSSEANHYRQVTQQFSGLRTEMIRSATTGQRQTQEIQTGLNYGVIGLTQPPVPGVFIHEDAQNKIEIHNATNNQEASAFWQPESTREYDTGFLSYRVDYNRFASSGDLYIEHGLLYRDPIPEETPKEYQKRIRDGEDVPPQRIVYESDQPLIEDNTITLYTITDGFEDDNLISSGISSTTVELTPTSPRSGGSVNTVTITDEDNPIQIILPTRLPASEWEELLDAGEADSSVESVKRPDQSDIIDDPPTGETTNLVEIKLKQGNIYNLRMAKIDIETLRQRTPKSTPDAEYIAVQNPTSQVSEDTTETLQAEARDKYNNGVIGKKVRVEAQTESGDCIGGFEQVSDTADPRCQEGSLGGEAQPGEDITDEEGIADFRYESPEVPEDRQVNFVYELVDD